jgi:hypothetical protein
MCLRIILTYLVGAKQDCVATLVFRFTKEDTAVSARGVQRGAVAASCEGRRRKKM